MYARRQRRLGWAELPESDGESQPGCPLTAGAILWPPLPKAQPPPPRPHARAPWCWDPPAAWRSRGSGTVVPCLLPSWRGAWLTPQDAGPGSSRVREELERGLLLQLGSTHKLCISDVHPETLCFRHGARRQREEGSLILLHNCKVNQLKRRDSYVSNTACALSSGVLHEKEEKVKLRSSIPSLFSDHYHTQNRDLLLFICGFGVFLLKWPKLPFSWIQQSGVVWEHIS